MTRMMYRIKLLALLVPITAIMILNFPPDENANMYGLLNSKFDPVVEGDNRCFMAISHVDREVLSRKLPSGLSVPDEATLRNAFPEIEIEQGKVPFMLSFCHGSNCHDIFTRMNVPEQEELMFVFPVLYKRQHLCSYIPVLYLDSFMGVMGGLWYGLRKEYHPSQIGFFETSADSHTTTWQVQDVINASYTRTEEEKNMPSFITQIFENPFVTRSYPGNYVFYKASVYPSKINEAIQNTLEWKYWGTKFSETVSSTFAEYHFTMSLPTGGKQYFS